MGIVTKDGYEKFFFLRGVRRFDDLLISESAEIKVIVRPLWWCVVSVIRGVGACNWANGVEVFWPYVLILSK